MNRHFSILMGLLLIVIGGVALALTLLFPVMGWGGGYLGVWRLWPLLGVAVGALLLLAPLCVRGKRGLGGLLIPGVPLLLLSGILLFSSAFNVWGVWGWLWPVSIWGLAVGFVAAALYMRVIWLLIPAIIIGVNGVLLQFCALSGWWSAWAVLWTLEPLAVGLALLVVNIRVRKAGLLIADLILCGIAAVSLIGMSALFPEWLLFNVLGPLILLGIGGIMLLVSLLRPRQPVLNASSHSES